MYKGSTRRNGLKRTTVFKGYQQRLREALRRKKRVSFSSPISAPADPSPSPSTLIPTPLVTVEVFSPSEDVKSQMPSLLEKINGLFEDNEEIRAPPNTTRTPSSCSPTSHTSDIACICFNCWGPTAAESSKSKTWKSLDGQRIPILPVFVKSPTDSLMMYGGGGAGVHTDARMQSTQMDLTTGSSVFEPAVMFSSCSACSSSLPPTARSDSTTTGTTTTSETFTSTCTIGCSSSKIGLLEENKLLEIKIRIQSEIIQKLVELSRVSDELLKKRKRD